MDALLENNTCIFTGRVSGPLVRMEGMIINDLCRIRFPEFNVDYAHIDSCLTMTMTIETFRVIAGQHSTFSSLLDI
jgi:hypothetical protein